MEVYSERICSLGKARDNIHENIKTFASMFLFNKQLRCLEPRLILVKKFGYLGMVLCISEKKSLKQFKRIVNGGVWKCIVELRSAVFWNMLSL